MLANMVVTILRHLPKIWLAGLIIFPIHPLLIAKVGFQIFFIESHIHCKISG